MTRFCFVAANGVVPFFVQIRASALDVDDGLLAQIRALERSCDLANLRLAELRSGQGRGRCSA